MNGSRVKTNPVVVPLAEPEKPRRRRRLRRESDKIYEEWEKADDRYQVAQRHTAFLSNVFSYSPAPILILALIEPRLVIQQLADQS